jgi:predicted TIM-barrel fold metal-dependent hydrolase
MGTQNFALPESDVLPGMLIDVHSHVGQYANARMSADGATLAGLFQQSGVTHGVTFSIEACYGAVDLGNEYTLREVAGQSCLSAMVVAHPAHPAASARWIRQAASNPRIVGVKLHPALGDYNILGVDMARLMEESILLSGLPVLSHVGNDSANVTIDKYLEFASRFPQVRFIAAHLGIGIMGSGDVAVNAWAKNPQPNVWFDMGTLRAFHTGAVEYLLDAVGPDRICFGTDSPLYHPAPFVRLLQALNVSQETREKIAFRNALTVIPSLASRLSTPVPVP